MENKYEMLYQLKMLLGIDESDCSSDSLLLFLIDDCISQVLGYCGRKELPPELVTLIPVMAKRAYEVNGYSQKDNGGKIKKIQQGERTIEFEGSEVAQKDWINDFTKRLEPFRIRRGRLPSEIGQDI